MQISTAGLIEIASYEGVCLRPYRDSVGVLTWGVGHTNAAGPPDIAAFPPDQDQPMGAVFAVFRRDLAAVEAEVNRLVKVPLAQHQFDALCSFHYNTGGLGRARLLTALNAGDAASAADGFLGWLKPPEIEGRRRKEMALFRDGVYSANGKALVFPVGERQQPLYSKGYPVDVATLLGAPVGAPATAPAPAPVPPFPWPRDVRLPPASSPPSPRLTAAPPSPRAPASPPASPALSPAGQGGLAALLAALVGGIVMFGRQAADWFAHLFN